MSNTTAQSLEAAILGKKLLSDTQYQQIKKREIETGIPFETALADTHILDTITLTKIKAEVFGIVFADPSDKAIQPDVLALIPEAIARKYDLIPLEKKEHAIVVAMSDPEDLEAIQFLERSTGMRIEVQLSTSELIHTALDREYSKSLGKGVTEAIEQAAATSTTKIEESLKRIEEAEDIIKVSPVAKIVAVILEYAIKAGASDIHIEPFETGTRIRYRIDGILQEKFPLPKSIHASVIARIKILADMKIDEQRKPLDGKIKITIGGKTVDLRVSTMPTIFGEKAVIRLLKDQDETFSLTQLGLWGKGLELFEKALKQSTGIILVTGPTGSGKTVTLATALAKVNTTKVNIITLEDPVEITIPGINQVQINQQAGLTFASGLRSILRQDPNVIMVGEIRDSETAQLAIQAALTGHLVLATLHTNSAAGAIPRLIDMKVENFLLASTLNVSLAQRLARRICPHCVESYEPDKGVKADVQKVLGPGLLQIGLGETPINFRENQQQAAKALEALHLQTTAKKGDANIDDIRLYRGKGCDKCNKTGYTGRIALYEVLEVTEEIRELTLQRASSEAIHKSALANNMISLVQDGYLKALWGLTTLEEVLTVADE